MFSKYNIFIFVSGSLLVGSVLSAHKPELIQRNTNGNILNLMARSSDTDGFLSCFGYYMEQVTIVSKKYEKEYEACCTDADSKRSAVDLENLDSRNSLANRTETSCAAVVQCKGASLVDEELGCYVNGGNANVKIFHSVANDASNELANYVEKMRLIESLENRCTNKTKETYEYKTIALYDDFTDCLLGGVKQPWSSTAPGPTQSPKPAPEPITSTIKPTTKLPEPITASTERNKPTTKETTVESD